MYQTTANSNAFVLGSCRISIPSSSGGYVNLGSARGVKLTEAWDSLEIETDNTPKIIIGAKNQTMTIEGSLLELDFHKLATLRGGLDSYSTASGMTFNSGGNTTITPQAVYLTHTSAAGSTQTIVTTVYYASITEGIQIPFPADDKTEAAEIPFKLKGICMSTRTAGSQLYNIIDSRANVYSTAYISTSI
jgi:acyl-CoA synthetase (AMP-forming)/AMP-acid ligase II